MSEKVKIFQVFNVDTETHPAALEKLVNDWLDAEHVAVLDMAYSISDVKVTQCATYSRSSVLVRYRCN